MPITPKSSKAEIYMESMAKIEENNLKKGWSHVEGVGYSYRKPEGWTESKNLEEGVYFCLTPQKGNIRIQLLSRYISSIPDGVSSLEEWAKLQYDELGMPEALLNTRKVEVFHGEVLEARVKIRDEHMKTRYYMNIFRENEDKRMWLLIVDSKEKDTLDSKEIEEFLKSLEISSFSW